MTTPSSVRGAPARRVSLARGAGAALLLTALAAPVAWAQSATASLRGYVRTSAGAPVADAQVSARSVETNQTRGAATSSAGFYHIGGLRPGRYEVTFRRIGFAPQSQTVQLLIGQTRDLNFTAAEAATQLSTVQVVAATTATETRTSEVATNITRDQIENLPNFERNFLDIAKLAPGITAQQVNNTDKFLAASGQPAEAVNVFVDGASYKNDVLKGGVVGQDASKGNPFPQGAVQEFRVITQNYKAEYQKAASAIITATTRSGTNRWEADAFGYFINKDLVQRDPFSAERERSRPEYSRTQAGASLGGPVVRDKLFFFGTYELNSRDEPQYVELGTNAAQAPAGLNPQQWVGQHTTEFTEHLGFGKLTWLKSDRSTLDASLTLRTESDFKGFGGQTTTEASETIEIDVYTAQASWRHAGSRWLNEAQLSGQHFVWNPHATNPTLIGREYAGIVRTGGKDTWQDFVQQRLSLRDDVSRTFSQWLGDHAFKGGASVDLLAYDVEKAFVGNPIYKFRSANNYAQPYAVAIGWGDPTMSRRNVQFGGYVQDDWSVTPKLTLNLGVRWDAETNMANNSYRTPRQFADSLRASSANLFVNQPVQRADGTCCDNRQRRVIDELGGLENFLTEGRSDRPIYLGAFQPRLGASYDLRGDGRTVLFGGFGIYFDRNYWNTLLDEQFRRQYNLLWHYEFNTAFPWREEYYDPEVLRNAIPTPKSEVFLIKNDLKPPRTHHFSGGVRQELWGTQLTVSYNGVRGYNFMNFIRASDWGGPNPSYAVVFAADDRVKTWYDAMQLQLQRPLGPQSRWGGGIAYTLARSEEQGQSTDMFWGWNDKYPTVADRPRLRAPGDQRHTVAANAVARLPWQILASGIVSLGSGIALNATDASGGWGPYQQRTYLFTPPTRPFLGLGSAFATQNADFRLEKGLTVGVGQTASVVLDLYNAFNSQNLGCYDWNNTIVPTADQNADWRARYGTAGCAALGRRIQLGLRYGYRGVQQGEVSPTPR